MRVKWGIMLAGLALSACHQATDTSGNTGSSAGTPTDSASSSAAPPTADQSISFRPGKWETTVQIVDVDMPGMPGGAMRDNMIDMMKKTKHVTVHCVTRDKAKMPSEQVFGGQSGTCEYRKMSMSDGQINGTMTCTGGDSGQKVTTTLSGHYSADQFAMENEMRTAMPGTGQEMHTRMKVTGRRLGECDS